MYNEQLLNKQGNEMRKDIYTINDWSNLQGNETSENGYTMNNLSTNKVVEWYHILNKWEVKEVPTWVALTNVNERHNHSHRPHLK